MKKLEICIKKIWLRRGKWLTGTSENFWRMPKEKSEDFAKQIPQDFYQKKIAQAVPDRHFPREQPDFFFHKYIFFIIFTYMNVLPIYDLPFHIVFLIFIIFSMVGWISEVLYVGIFFEHKFVNRGFLHGPLCPIYGFGGLSILLLPQALYSTWWPLFCASMLFGTIVEYLSSWILEKLFHTRWWDYSRYKFNIRGRVCLLNSVLFGVLGVVIIHFVQPFVMKFLSLFSDFVLNLSADIIAVALTVDLLITVRRLVDFSVTMEKVRALREKYGADFIKKLEQFQPKLRNLESFMRRFPTLKSINYKDELEMLRERVKTAKSKIIHQKHNKS